MFGKKRKAVKAALEATMPFINNILLLHDVEKRTLFTNEYALGFLTTIGTINALEATGGHIRKKQETLGEVALEMIDGWVNDETLAQEVKDLNFQLASENNPLYLLGKNSADKVLCVMMGLDTHDNDSDVIRAKQKFSTEPTTQELSTTLTQELFIDMIEKLCKGEYNEKHRKDSIFETLFSIEDEESEELDSEERRKAEELEALLRGDEEKKS